MPKVDNFPIQDLCDSITSSALEKFHATNVTKQTADNQWKQRQNWNEKGRIMFSRKQKCYPVLRSGKPLELLMLRTNDNEDVAQGLVST